MSLDEHVPSSVHFVALPPDRSDSTSTSSPFQPSAAARRFPASFPSASSSSPSFSASAPNQPPPPPSLYDGFCGTRRRCVRCSAVLLAVLLLCAGGFALNWVTRSERGAQANPSCDSWVNEYRITPDAVSTCPAQTLLLTYSQRLIPYASTLTQTSLTRRLPNVTLPLSVSPDAVYLLFILDIDFPEPANASLRAKTHSIIANIPPPPPPSLTLNLTQGDTLFAYQPLCPPPPPFTGFHRYVILVYNTVTRLHPLPNATLIPPYRMSAEGLLGLLWNADLSGNLVGGSFFYAQFGDFFC